MHAPVTESGPTPSLDLGSRLGPRSRSSSSLDSSRAALGPRLGLGLDQG